MNEAIIKTKNIGTGNTFEPGVIIGEEVHIGDNNVFRSGTVIDRKVCIGNNNLFSNYVIIGCQGEMGLKGDIIPAGGCIEIGNDNIIREFVVISFPAKTLKTKVGNNCYFMARSHIPHDCKIGNKVTMAPNSVLGGAVHIEDFVFVGLGATTHHGLSLGEGSMIGMNAANVKCVPPFVAVIGVPSKILCVNIIGATRRNIPAEIINEADANLTSVLNLSYTNPQNQMITKMQDFLQKFECVNEFA